MCNDYKENNNCDAFKIWANFIGSIPSVNEQKEI